MSGAKTLGQVAMRAFDESLNAGRDIAEAWQFAGVAAVIAQKAKQKACQRCNGRGVIRERRGTSYETDTAEERAMNWRDVTCPECGI